MKNMIRKIIHGTLPFLFVAYQIVRGRKFGFSFNVADRCPANCNCYWRAMERVKELPNEQVIKFFHEQKKQGKRLATIIGGEPYVRLELLRKLTTILPGNWVVTSGTIPLMSLPKTTHFISVDGKDAETHDKVRGTPGLYNRIISNLITIRSKGKFPAYIHTVLNSLNYKQIGEILRVWKENKLADGVTFSIFTHIKDSNNDSLMLTRYQQEWVVQKLLRQKKVFGNFLCMTPKMIESYYPDKIQKQKPSSCGTARFVDSFDAAGNKIPQCIFSEKTISKKAKKRAKKALRTIKKYELFSTEGRNYLNAFIFEWIILYDDRNDILKKFDKYSEQVKGCLKNEEKLTKEINIYLWKNMKGFFKEKTIHDFISEASKLEMLIDRLCLRYNSGSISTNDINQMTSVFSEAIITYSKKDNTNIELKEDDENIFKLSDYYKKLIQIELRKENINNFALKLSSMYNYIILDRNYLYFQQEKSLLELHGKNEFILCF